MVNPFTLFALMLGVGIKFSNPQEALKTEAASHSVTVQRSNFLSWNLSYNAVDQWIAVGTDGVT